MKSFFGFIVKLFLAIVFFDVALYTGFGVVPIIIVMYVGYRVFNWLGRKRDYYKEERDAWLEFKNSRGL